MNMTAIDQVRELTAKADAARTQAIQDCQQRLARAVDQRDKEIARVKNLYDDVVQEINAVLAELGVKTTKRGRPAGASAEQPERRRARKGGNA